MKYYSLDEFRAIQDKQQYKCLALATMSGKDVYKYNAGKTDADMRLDQIEKRLESPAMTDAYYVIKGKHALSSNVQADEYIIKVKDVAEEPGKPVSVPPMVVTGPDVLSYEKALELNTELARLKLENESLLNQIEDLELQIEDLKAESEEHLSEKPVNNIGEWIKSTIEMITPAVDKHFELREKQLQIDQLRVYNDTQRLQKIPPVDINSIAKKYAAPQQTDDQAVLIMDQKIQEFISGIDDEDTAEDMVQIYNSAEDMDNFFNQVSAYDQGLLTQLQNYVNGKSA